MTLVSFKPTLDYEDIFVHLNYAGIGYRYVCEDNPSDGSNYADEQDVKQLLNCILIATVTRANTAGFEEWKLEDWRQEMLDFIDELESGEGLLARKDSESLRAFEHTVRSVDRFAYLHPMY